MLTNFHKKLIDLLKTDDRLLDEEGETHHRRHPPSRQTT